MVVCEIAPAVVGLPDDISFGVIHTSRLFALHAEELTVGEYLKYAPPIVAVRKFIYDFHFISTITAPRLLHCVEVTQANTGLTWKLAVPDFPLHSLGLFVRPSA